MFGRQRKKQERRRHQYEVANNYVFKCCLKVDSDDDDITDEFYNLIVFFVKLGTADMSVGKKLTVVLLLQ